MKPTNFSERNQNIRKVMLFTVASVLLAALLVAALIYTPQERDRLDLYKDNTSANTANNVKVIPGDDVDDLKKDLAYLQQLIMKKDERIVQLEDNLNEQRLVSNSPKHNNTVRFQYRNDSIRRENESLKKVMMEKESQYTSILSMINTLKKENESLTAKINKLSTGNSTITNEMLKNEKSRAALLEKRISDLNAELRFAKVDCNLTRADVTQIISNSKQRKELLAEALASLNNLSRSDDAVIAQKAKEKFQRLNNIAKTVRD